MLIGRGSVGSSKSPAQGQQIQSLIEVNLKTQGVTMRKHWEVSTSAMLFCRKWGPGSDRTLGPLVTGQSRPASLAWKPGKLTGMDRKWAICVSGSAWLSESRMYLPQSSSTVNLTPTPSNQNYFCFKRIKELKKNKVKIEEFSHLWRFSFAITMEWLVCGVQVQGHTNTTSENYNSEGQVQTFQWKPMLSWLLKCCALLSEHFQHGAHIGVTDVRQVSGSISCSALAQRWKKTRNRDTRREVGRAPRGRRSSQEYKA